jgi:hypothetical protein
LDSSGTFTLLVFFGLGRHVEPRRWWPEPRVAPQLPEAALGAAAALPLHEEAALRGAVAVLRRREEAELLDAAAVLLRRGEAVLLRRGEAVLPQRGEAELRGGVAVLPRHEEVPLGAEASPQWLAAGLL